jgi:hypothetical protein
MKACPVLILFNRGRRRAGEKAHRQDDRFPECLSDIHLSMVLYFLPNLKARVRALRMLGIGASYLAVDPHRYPSHGLLEIKLS